MQDLIKALIKAKDDFKDIVKDTKAFNYKYAALDQVISVTRAPLSNNGLVVIQSPISEGDKVGVRTTLYHEGGASISYDFVTDLFKKDCQAVGSQVTYFRRYSLLSMMGLSPVDDDGQAALPKNHKNAAKLQMDPNTKAVNAQVASIKTLCAKILGDKTSEEKQRFIKTDLEVNKFDDLYSMSLDFLQNKKAALEALVGVVGK